MSVQDRDLTWSTIARRTWGKYTCALRYFMWQFALLLLTVVLVSGRRDQDFSIQNAYRMQDGPVKPDDNQELSEQLSTNYTCEKDARQTECRTMWELMTCITKFPLQITMDAVNAPGVGMRALLDEPAVSFSFFMAPDTYYMKNNRNPGSTKQWDMGDFDPTIARFTFLYMSLPGPWDVNDLLAIGDVDTVMWGTFQTYLKLNDISQKPLALVFQNSSGKVVLSETAFGKAGWRATVLANYTACNGKLYVVDVPWSRVLRLDQNSFPAGYNQPLFQNPQLSYRPYCNLTIQEMLKVAYLTASDPWNYYDFLEEIIPPTGMTVEKMSFTLILPDKLPPLPKTKDKDVARSIIMSTMLFLLLPGSWCTEDLLIMGNQRTLLGLYAGQNVSLSFKEGDLYPGAADVLANNLRVGTISKTQTTCRSVVHSMGMGRPGSVTLLPAPMEVSVAPDGLAKADGDLLQVPLTLDPDRLPKTAKEFWKLVESLTSHYKRNPAGCSAEYMRHYQLKPQQTQMPPRQLSSPGVVPAPAPAPALAPEPAASAPAPAPTQLPNAPVAPPKPTKPKTMPPLPAPRPAPGPDSLSGSNGDDDRDGDNDHDGDNTQDNGGTDPLLVIAVVVPVTLLVLFVVTIAGLCYYSRRKRDRDSDAGTGTILPNPPSSFWLSAALMRWSSQRTGRAASVEALDPGSKSDGKIRHESLDMENSNSVDDTAKEASDTHEIMPLDGSPQRDATPFQLSGPAFDADPPGTPSGTRSILMQTAESSASLQQAVESVNMNWIIENHDLEYTGKILGQGSFGEVSLGKLNSTLVAIKRCKVYGESEEEKRVFESNMKALFKEVSIMAGLRHPNIVLLMGVVLQPPSIVTEYCGKGSLYNVIKAANKLEQKFDWRRRLQMALEAATGMEFLHSRTPPVLHCDLKSPNILVDQAWHIKVADFGLARIVDTAKSRTSMSLLNPKWMAPEVIRDHKHSTGADVYSFGMVLWELLTLQEPYSDKHPIQLAFAVVQDGLRPEIPEDLQAIPGGSFPGIEEYVALMQECWVHDPEDRPNFQTIVTRLNKIKRDYIASAKAAGPSTPKHTRMPSKERLKHAAAAAIHEITHRGESSPRRPATPQELSVMERRSMKSPVCSSDRQPLVKALDDEASHSGRSNQGGLWSPFQEYRPFHGRGLSAPQICAAAQRAELLDGESGPPGVAGHSEHAEQAGATDVVFFDGLRPTALSSNATKRDANFETLGNG